MVCGGGAGQMDEAGVEEGVEAAHRVLETEGN